MKTQNILCDTLGDVAHRTSGDPAKCGVAMTFGKSSKGSVASNGSFEKNIQTGAAQMLVAQRVKQSLIVHEAAPSDIDQPVPLGIDRSSFSPITPALSCDGRRHRIKPSVSAR